MADFVRGQVTVSVPASSANLGPGYDSLGLALDLRDRVTARVVEHGTHIHVTGAGAGQVPVDESHLVYQAMLRTFTEIGCEVPGVRLNCANRIPHGRGLGSSSAAIVAGVCAARSLVVDGQRIVDDDQALRLAASLEGHPDNVAPALHGGFTIAVRRGDGYVVTTAPVDGRIGVVLFVPPQPVGTTLARSVLPETVAHSTAAANAGRAALLVAALGGRPELLLWATEDLLHQDHREPLMPRTLRLVRELRSAGVPAVVSGAGPSVLAFLDGSRVDEAARARLLGQAPSGWRAEEIAISRGGPVVTAPEPVPE